MSGKNQAIAGPRGSSGFHAIDSVPAEQFVRVPKHVIQFPAGLLKRDLALLLRNIKPKARLVHRVTR